MGQGYNSLNTFTPFMPYQIGFGGLGYSGSSAKTETSEEAEIRTRKEKADKAIADYMKRMELIKKQAEDAPKIQAQIDEIEKTDKEITQTLEKAKKGIETAEGTIKVKETWDDYKKLPWWKKALRAGGQMLQGTAKLAMSFVGYETDPKTGEYSWNWKKCLKNVAIATVCISATAIPVAGPFISTGLLATGVVCGTYGSGKGVYKAFKAKSPEELDNAYQDIGAGLAIGVTSACGLRGLGKGLQTSTAVSASNSAGSAVRATGSNVVSQFVKDATVNAYRATVAGAKAQKATVAAQGFSKTYGANLKNSFVPKLGKSKFEEANYETTQRINTRLNEINNELSSSGVSPIRKALLEREQIALNAQKTELQNVITKDGWKALRTDSKLRCETKDLQSLVKDIQTNGSVDINGTSFSSTTENLKAIEQAVKQSKELSKQIETLAKLRSATMKKMAFCKKYASEVEAYTGKTRTNRLGRIYDSVKISKSDITWKNSLKTPLKAAWNYMNIPFKIWGYTDKNGGNGFYKIQETFIPTYEAGMLDMFLGFGDRELTTKVVQQTEDGKTVEQEIAVTKDVLVQLEEQKQQLDTALSQAQGELNKLYYQV